MTINVDRKWGGLSWWISLDVLLSWLIICSSNFSIEDKFIDGTLLSLFDQILNPRPMNLWKKD